MFSYPVSCCGCRPYEQINNPTKLSELSVVTDEFHQLQLQQLLAAKYAHNFISCAGNKIVIDQISVPIDNAMWCLDAEKLVGGNMQLLNADTVFIYYLCTYHGHGYIE